MPECTKIDATIPADGPIGGPPVVHTFSEEDAFLRELMVRRGTGMTSEFLFRSASGGEFSREWCARFAHSLLDAASAARALALLIESGTDGLILATHAKKWGGKSPEALDACRRLIGPDAPPDVKLRFVRCWPDFPFRIEERVGLALSVDEDLAPKGRSWGVGTSPADRRRVLDFIMSGVDLASSQELMRHGRFLAHEWAELFQSPVFDPAVASENPTLPSRIHKLLALAAA